MARRTATVVGLLPPLLLSLLPRLGAAAAARYAPHHSHSCNPPNNKFPFCDPAVPLQERVADLISRQSLAFKIENRYDQESGDGNLGLDDYNYNMEGLHGLGAQCLTVAGVTRCPTIFAAPPAMAASWNLTLLHDVGDAISTEVRAYNNFGGNRGYLNRAVDLNAWLPSINIARDPRWGRQVETYSEDPIATGMFGAAIVDGAQRGKDGGASGNGYLKLIVAVKHATGYQVETARFSRNENISVHDLFDTFYPAWEIVIEQGHATGFMCAYPAINGIPCCSDPYFETQLIRETWGMGTSHQGGSYAQGDCGAVEMISSEHHYAANFTFAAAYALNAGTDIDCGNGLRNNLGDAIAAGLTTERQLDASLARTYTLQFLAGRFDPVELQPYMQIPFDAIDSREHADLAYETGLQGMVLLRNDGGLLPLPVVAGSGRIIAVVGPFANNSDLAGTYYEQRCADGTTNCIPTLRAALIAALGNGSGTVVLFAAGCDVPTNDPSGIPAALAVAAAADVVIVAVGTNAQVATEDLDRTTTDLPGAQTQLANAVLALGKPTVVILFNGGALGIDSIVNHKNGSQQVAIVEAFFPGETGGVPVVAHLLGRANRWGKMPVTMYPLAWEKTTPIDSMNMSAPPGRTYKYYTGAPLASFGSGLSYTTFSLAGSCPQAAAAGWAFDSAAATLADARGRGALAAAAPPLQCSITVTNEGSQDGDEVVFLFIVPNKAAIETARGRALGGTGSLTPDPLALKQLADFRRVSVPVGRQVAVDFNVTIGMLASVDLSGNRVVWPGEYTLMFSRGHGAAVNETVRVELTQREPRAAALPVDRLAVRTYPKRR